jgi:fatty acid desaturase
LILVTNCKKEEVKTFFFFFFLVVIGALWLLGKHLITWAMPPILCALVTFQIWSCIFYLRLA